jgi:hypothetical protein
MAKVSVRVRIRVWVKVGVRGVELVNTRQKHHTLVRIIRTRL